MPDGTLQHVPQGPFYVQRWIDGKRVVVTDEDLEGVASFTSEPMWINDALTLKDELNGPIADARKAETEARREAWRRRRADQTISDHSIADLVASLKEHLDNR